MYIACTFTDQPRSVGCSKWRSLGSTTRDAVDQPGGTWCVHTPASCASDLRHAYCSDGCTSDTAAATGCAKVRASSKKRVGCMHRLRQCTLYYVFADTDARAHAAATLEGHAKAADETGVWGHVRADDTATTRPGGARGRALDTSRRSRRKAAATPRPPRHRHVPLLLAEGIVRVMGRTDKHTVRSTTKTWATSRGSILQHPMVSLNRTY